MNFASDAPTLFVLHGHQAAGKSPQLSCPEIDHSFQFKGAIADRLLEHFAVMNIGAGSVPFNDAPLGISKRNSASAEPAVFARDATYTVFGLIRFTGLDAFHPMRQAAFFIVRMQILHPTETNG